MKLAIYQIADRGEARPNPEDAYDAIVSTRADFFILPELFALAGGDYKRHCPPAEAYAETGRPGLLVCFDLVCHGTRDLLGARSDFVLAPVGMSVPDHPVVDGYPASTAIATKHGVTVAQVCRVGFYGRQPLVVKSAVVTPGGVFWEGSGEGEELAVVDLPWDSGQSRKGMD